MGCRSKSTAIEAILDFGGDKDLFRQRLRANGFPVAVTYDPIVPAHARRPEGKFDLVTCFETLEHVASPSASVALIVEWSRIPGRSCMRRVVQPAISVTKGWPGGMSDHATAISRCAAGARLGALWGHTAADFIASVTACWRFQLRVSCRSRNRQTILPREVGSTEISRLNGRRSTSWCNPSSGTARKSRARSDPSSRDT